MSSAGRSIKSNISELQPERKKNCKEHPRVITFESLFFFFYLTLGSVTA